jgi:hypothetical protein
VVIKNEGMPLAQTGELVVDTNEHIKPVQQKQKGDLILRFNIKFP